MNDYCLTTHTHTYIYIYIYIYTHTHTHRLLLCSWVRAHPNECPRYNTKHSDDEVSVILELWGMWSTHLLPSLPGPL